jgi:hypothetical protein
VGEEQTSEKKMSSRLCIKDVLLADEDMKLKALHQKIAQENLKL